jgi:hypothetical protein
LSLDGDPGEALLMAGRAFADPMLAMMKALLDTL